MADNERGRTARDVMTPDPVTASPDLRVADAAKIMLEERVGALPVVDEGRLVGIVSEADLIAQDLQLEFPTYMHLLDGMVMYPPVAPPVQEQPKRATAATVREVMSTHPLTVSTDADVRDVASLMMERDVGRVLVTEDDRLVGIIAKSDIIRSMITE